MQNFVDPERAVSQGPAWCCGDPAHYFTPLLIWTLAPYKVWIVSSIGIFCDIDFSLFRFEKEPANSTKWNLLKALNPDFEEGDSVLKHDYTKAQQTALDKMLELRMLKRLGKNVHDMSGKLNWLVLRYYFHRKVVWWHYRKCRKYRRISRILDFAYNKWFICKFESCIKKFSIH